MSDSLDVAVIGGGMSGLFIGYHLQNAGYQYTIYEKSANVGGTWYDNTYPGLFVDIITRRYEFPFARNHTWSRRYAPGSEIRDYLQRFARTTGVMAHTRLSTETTEARFVDGRWELTLADGSTVTHDILVCATGFLRVPRVPDFLNAEAFRGPAFHSARWDHSVDFNGKRIGVIGTGSSGIQIVSELGRQGHQVTHFIRTPQWIQVKENPRITMIEKLMLRTPLARYWDQKMAKLRIETDGPEVWRLRPGPERDERQRVFLADLEREIPDPELRARFTPTEALGCKRIPKTPDYYRVVQQPNVTPVFGAVAELLPDGVLGSDGARHELDVLIYATGFDTHAYMRPMKVFGEGGVPLDDVWRDGVYSYRGVAVPGMPNLFLLCGPFAPVNALSIPATLADEVGYIMRLLEIIHDKSVPLAPSAQATKSFREEIAAGLPGTTFVLCDNWWQDRTGSLILWPFTAAQHGAQYTEVQLGDYEGFLSH